jgi:hypothetical protein
MPGEVMNEEQLRDWILRRLGAPFWQVELTCDHINDAIEDARRWFVAKKGQIKNEKVDIAPSQTEYPLPDYMEVVVDVASSHVVSVLTPIADEFGFNQIIVGPGYEWHSYKYFLSDLYQRLQYLEVGKQVLDANLEWRVEDRTLIILPKKTVGGPIIIFYKTNQVTIEQLGERDHDLVKRFALMRSKEMLGRIRSRYDSYDTATGAKSLDGPALLDEARMEEERLQEEISQSGYPMLFQTG